jgi:hypothetical protein
VHKPHQQSPYASVSLRPFKVINNKSNVLVYEGNFHRREELCTRYVLHLTSGRERCINLTNSRRTPLSCHCFSAIDTMYKREAVGQWMVGYDLMSKVSQQAWLIELMNGAEKNKSRPTYRATRQIYSLPYTVAAAIFHTPETSATPGSWVSMLMTTRTWTITAFARVPSWSSWT